MEQFVRSVMKEAEQAVSSLLANDQQIKNIAHAAQLLANAFKSGGKVYSCGNGGSMCDAMHFAEELSGRFRSNRQGLPAISISDPSHITCVGNDYGFDEIFSRYIEAHGRKGDVLLAISTSGKSPNVLRACQVAQQMGLSIISLTGRPESPIGTHAQIDICCQAGQYADRVQELHIKVIHTLIELIERHMFPENYGAGK